MGASVASVQCNVSFLLAEPRVQEQSRRFRVEFWPPHHVFLPGEASFTTSGIGKMRYGNSPNKLFIGNLSLEVTSDDLVEVRKK